MLKLRVAQKIGRCKGHCSACSALLYTVWALKDEITWSEK